MKNKSLQRGFTLTDLITTLAVAGISASLAVPSFNNVLNNNRRQSAVNEFVSSLHVARSEAITRNMRVVVCSSANGIACDGAAWKSGWLVFADTDADRTLDVGETVLMQGSEKEHIQIASADFATVLSYRPNGRIMGAAVANNQGELTFCDPRGVNHARVVIVSPSGNPRLSETTMAGAAPVCP